MHVSLRSRLVRPVLFVLVGTLASQPLDGLRAATDAASSKPAAGSAVVGFRVSPDKVSLTGNFDRAQLLVTQVDDRGASDTHSNDLTQAAKYVSDQPQIATVNAAGQLLARGNGSCRIAVTVGNRTVQVPVDVTGVEAQAKVDFARDVAPILSKTGCNSASCHASQHGKGGFKLSVFGFAPEEDYRQMVRDWRGRRVDLLEPEKSLMLLKPTLAVPHGGNRRLNVGGVEYETLRAWLAGGAPPPTKNDVTVKSIRIEPPIRVGTVGMTQQLRVVAEYSDGRSRDVTALAKYDSMDEMNVAVSAAGLIQATGKGQVAVMVRFEGQAEAASVTVPFSAQVQLAGWQNNNFIDELAEAKFREVGVEPSPLCDDATFVRRAYLDAVGTLPKIEEVQAFLKSKSPTKRADLIDALLGLTGDPAKDLYNNAYTSYWSLKWADLIRSSALNVGEQGMWTMHNWLHDSFRENKPYDQFVRELVMAKGSTFMEGPANFYRIAKSPPDAAETVAQLFLGVRLQCAKCHHHPMEKYSQEDYYGFAAFFARVGQKSSQEFGLFAREPVVMVAATGDVRHPKTGAVLRPTPLEGTPIDDEPLDRRQPLADWLTSSHNEFFAKNLVNRYIGYLFGRGLVEPIDDLRATNPASNEALLNALAQNLIESKYDLKQLLRTIMNSRLYQLDSQPTEANAADERYYSHYKVKRIAAEPLLDAVDQATGTQTKFRNMPLGTRAIDLPDAEYPDYFLAVFGKPKRVSVCECERSPDENLAQALHTLNGDVLSKKINDPKGRVAKLVKKPYAAAMAELYLATVARSPSDRELAAFEPMYNEASDKKMFFEDVLWSLMNSKQFLFVR
jgi:hypothetical protein